MKEKIMGRQSIFPVRTARARCTARIDIVQSIDAPFSPGLRPKNNFFGTWPVRRTHRHARAR